MRKFFSYLLVVITLTFVTYSCSDESQNSAKKSELTNQPIETVKFLGSAFRPNNSINAVKGNFTNSEQTNEVYAGKLTLDHSEFLSFYNKLSSTLNLASSDNKIASYVLYINEFQSRVTVSNIQGISLFIQDNSGLNHRLFIKRDGVFSEVQAFNKIVNSFTTNDFDLLLNYCLKNSNNFTRPAHVFFVSNESFPANTNARLQTSENVSLSSVIIDNQQDLAMYAASGCGSSCYSDDGGCTYDEFGEGFCDACAGEQMEVAAMSNSISFDTHATFSKSKAYDFRDNFLKKYKKGKEYVGYYYKLSYLIKAKKTINRENFWAHVSLGKKLYDAASKAQYGNDNDIIVTDELRNESIAMINYYASSTTNPGFPRMLENIKEDVEKFSRMSKKEIIQSIK